NHNSIRSPALPGRGRRGHDGPHLLEAGTRDSARILFPVLAVEEPEWEVAVEADRLEDAHQLAEGGDAVAGVNAVGIGDRLAGGIGRVVVHMKDVDGRVVE